MQGQFIPLPTLLCKRCGHTWHPRGNRPPDVCPKCGSYLWNEDKTKPKVKPRGGTRGGQ